MKPSKLILSGLQIESLKLQFVHPKLSFWNFIFDENNYVLAFSGELDTYESYGDHPSYDMQAVLQWVRLFRILQEIFENVPHSTEASCGVCQQNAAFCGWMGRCQCYVLRSVHWRNWEVARSVSHGTMRLLQVYEEAQWVNSLSFVALIEVTGTCGDVLAHLCREHNGSCLVLRTEPEVMGQPLPGGIAEGRFLLARMYGVFQTLHFAKKKSLQKL